MLSAYLSNVGILAPGLDSWQRLVEVLQQPENYQATPIEKKIVPFLPANEHRRVSRVTLLALAAARQLGDVEELRQALQIFSLSDGDITTFDQISRALAMPGRPVSPIKFHNSVHNSGAGYWSIATDSQTPSTSLGGGLQTFSVSLLDAMVQLNASDNQSHRECLMVCYDEIPSAPFLPLLTIKDEFACALRLSLNHTHPSSQTLCKLEINIEDCGPQEPVSTQPTAVDTLLTEIINSNTQGIALLLLAAVARLQSDGKARQVVLPYFEQHLRIKLKPVTVC